MTEPKYRAYEGPKPPNPERLQRWTITQISQRGDTIFAAIICNDDSRGIISVKNFEELEWLKNRLTADRILDRKPHQTS